MVVIRDEFGLFKMKNNAQQILVMEEGRIEGLYWKDLWRHRDLLYYLAWRDILVRYKQTVIGIAWSIIRPLLTMLVFVIVFGKIAKLPSIGVPYPILVYTAILPWQFFANALAESSNSLIENEKLITKVYFPRLVIPASTVMVSVIDFLLSFVILGLLMAWYHFIPSWRIIFIPVFFLIALSASLGLGFWLSALNVKYRDFRYIVPFIVQLGLYISPVGFSSSIITEKWRLLFSLNPMVGVIDGFRWAILGGENRLYLSSFIISLCIAGLLLIMGLWYFRKTERAFADLV